MRWKAAAAVNIHGTNYAPGQSVSTDSWTNAQVAHQIYLGHIIEDRAQPMIKRIEGAGGEWTLTYTSYHPFSFAARGTFEIPDTPSRRVLFISKTHAHGLMGNSFIRCRLEIRTGSSVGNGTLIHTSDQHYHRGANVSYGISAHTLQGVTSSEAGKTYNVVQAFTATAGGGVLTMPQIIVVPSQD